MHSSSSSTFSKASTTVLLLLLLISQVLCTDVYSWGLNDYGQLGLGSFVTPVYHPTIIPTYQSLSVSALTASYGFHLASINDGTVYVCGNNYYGQLTLDPTNVGIINYPLKSSSLAAIQSPPKLTLTISASYGDVIGLTNTGNLYGWGFAASFLRGKSGVIDQQWAPPAQLSQYTGQVVKAAVVNDATFIWLANGTIVVSGINNQGILGIGATDNVFHNLAAMPFWNDNGLNVTIPSTSSGFALALTPDGHVYSWGGNYNGELGVGDLSMRNIPTLVSSLIEQWHIIQILPGQNHTLALSCNGHVLAWGANAYGQVGQGSLVNDTYTAPQLVLDLLNEQVVEIFTAAYHNYALTSKGDWYVWGGGLNGVLGLGANITGNVLAPTLNPYLKALSINQIVAGSTGRSVFGWENTAHTVPVCPISLTNECLTETCGFNALCVDSDLSWYCICANGYYGNPNVGCVPIDYCSILPDYCQQQANCSYEQDIGTYCVCSNGFGDGVSTKYGGQGCLAYPTNCSSDPCAPYAVCTNVSSTRAECSCPTGFDGDGYTARYNGTGCTDIDECDTEPTVCGENAVCNNTIGSFECTCVENATAVLVNNATSCVYDVCSSTFTSCAANAVCSANLTYEDCSCPDGYIGDGILISLGGSGCTVAGTSSSSTGASNSTSTSSSLTSGSTSTTGPSNSTTGNSTTTSSTSTGNTTGRASSTSSTSGGGVPSTKDNSDLWSTIGYTGRVPANPHVPTFQQELALNASAIIAPTSAPISHQDKVTLGVVVAMVGLLLIIAFVLAVYFFATRKNYVHAPIRYTNNPDNVVI